MSYDEHLITQAGGDGEPETGLWITKEERTVARIALKQAMDRETSLTARIRISRVISALNMAATDPKPTPPAAPTPRTEDWTHDELFPSHTSWLKADKGVWYCQECSALVNDSVKHVAWHNKLLP